MSNFRHHFIIKGFIYNFVCVLPCCVWSVTLRFENNFSFYIVVKVSFISSELYLGIKLYITFLQLIS